MGKGGGTGWGGVEGWGENADNCNNKNKKIKSNNLKKVKGSILFLCSYLLSFPNIIY